MKKFFVDKDIPDSNANPTNSEPGLDDKIGNEKTRKAKLRSDGTEDGDFIKYFYKDEEGNNKTKVQFVKKFEDVDDPDKPVFRKNLGSLNGSGNAIVKSDKLAAMEPTIVNINMVFYNDSAQWNQMINLGVKSMVRLVKSNLMVANMIEASKDQGIFKFIKWTKGEYGLHDLLLGFSEMKSSGVGAARGNWLKALKNRKRLNNIYKLVDHRLLPNCTIIITDAEAEQVRLDCGLDLRSASVVKKIMSKYFLLGFGIYDTESKVLDIMYDSDQTFASYSLRALTSAIKKELIIDK
jgi:hypothetical protein